ncbi:MAG: histidinol dehydrogenase [Wenzhouxiangella sp.]|nr:histidinol dehydrogenase [Wenzhouxiangella sp.]TVR96060.1 MAG: histidinol dehydrogenase [Wenzhouxiangellaceae bacterium]
MKIVQANQLDGKQLAALLARPAMESDAELRRTVADIVGEVRRRGDQALLDFGERFDGRRPSRLLASRADLEQAADELDADLLKAIDTAIDTIGRFHAAGKPTDQVIETAPGVTCQARWRALDPVGLYVPAGSAPLPSTAIMLAVPARLAGCQRIVLATPPGPDGRADAAVRAIAHRMQIDTVLVAGGAQAVAAMAYGTESVPRVAKIFGPGNRFVTEAKRLVAESADGAAMDLPAGPSEVMVIADDSADPVFVAIDLLSQAEHGPDSQVFLVTNSLALAQATEAALSDLLDQLPRAATARQALDHGAILLVDDLDQAVAVANDYAPEHLIIATEQPNPLCDQIITAGSVFLGHYTPESLGDYISGTNHVLPTAGWARSRAGLSLIDFMRRMTVQEATPAGLKTLGPPGARLAAHEGLEAHRLAITLRLEKLGKGAGT